MDMEGADDFDGDDTEYLLCPECGYYSGSSNVECVEISEEKECVELFDEGEYVRNISLVDVNERGSADDPQTTEYIYGVDHSGNNIKNIEILEEMCVCLSCRRKYRDFYQMYEENHEDVVKPVEPAMAKESAKPEAHATPEEPTKREGQAMPEEPAKPTEQTSLDANVDLVQYRAPRNDLAENKLQADIHCC